MEKSIEESLQHRMKLLESASFQLKGTLTKIEVKQTTAKKAGSTLHAKIKKDIVEASEALATIHKDIQFLGKQLKNKIRTGEAQVVIDKINMWPLEEFMTRDTLKKDFARYSQK